MEQQFTRTERESERSGHEVIEAIAPLVGLSPEKISGVAMVVFTNDGNVTVAGSVGKDMIGEALMYGAMLESITSGAVVDANGLGGILAKPSDSNPMTGLYL